MVNGRISDRTWPKYRRFKKLFSPILRLPDRIFVQSKVDFERFRELGARDGVIAVEANLKYDAAAHPVPLNLPTFGAEQVWIAASTVGPNERGSLQRHSVVEEKLVLDAFRDLASFRKSAQAARRGTKQEKNSADLAASGESAVREFPQDLLLQDLLLIVAPRQPARFEEVAELLERSEFPVLRRSRMTPDSAPQLPLPGILLLDTMGELARIYPLADVVFVGGSLAPRGGHNILEPAFAGAPIVVGPHMQNFEAVCRDFREADAICQVPDAKALLKAVRRLLDNPEDAKALGRRGEELARSRTGVAQRLARNLVQWQARFAFRPPRPFFLRFPLGLLALAWEMGGTAKRSRSERIAAGRSPLGVPVISVGGITLGGSGKTPFTNYLATRLKRHGFRPAILTRGYRRRAPAKHLLIAPGTSIPAPFTGDEAQIFLRTGLAAVGIGTDRYETGRELLARYPETGVLLLDDGFQHAKLPRDADIVLIDGLDPFGGEHVVPAGRLREPVSALARADVFVVTRCQSPDHLEGLTARLREINPNAPVFESRIKILGWRRVRTGERMQISAGRRVAAFCGLGNPANFFFTLERLGLEVLTRTTFGDHHPYHPAELRRLALEAMAQGAEVLVTTEKDRVNFPHSARAALGDMETAWLEIEISLVDEPGFFAALESRLGRPLKRAAR